MKILPLLLILCLAFPIASAYLQPESPCEKFIQDVAQTLDYTDEQIIELSPICQNNTIYINQSTTEIINQTFITNQTFYIDNSTEKIFNNTIQNEKSSSEDFLQQTMQLVLLKQLGLSGDSNTNQNVQQNASSYDDAQLKERMLSIETSISALRSEIKTSQSEPEKSSPNYLIIIFGIGILGVGVYVFREKLFPKQQINFPTSYDPNGFNKDAEQLPKIIPQEKPKEKPSFELPKEERSTF